MFAHVFEPSPGDINVIVWDNQRRSRKVEEKQFRTSSEAIDWLADECEYPIMAIKTEWWWSLRSP